MPGSSEVIGGSEMRITPTYGLGVAASEPTSALNTEDLKRLLAERKPKRSGRRSDASHACPSFGVFGKAARRDRSSARRSCGIWV